MEKSPKQVEKKDGKKESEKRRMEILMKFKEKEDEQLFEIGERFESNKIEQILGEIHLNKQLLKQIRDLFLCS